MITEKHLIEIERRQEIAADICMTEPYHTSEKFISDYEMKMSELQAESEAAEKAAKDNRPCEEIPF